MKKLLALILAVLTLTAALCGCGNTAAPGTSGNDAPVSTPDASEPGSDTGNSGNAVVTTNLPGTFEIAATDPHYIIATPDWHAESCGYGFSHDGVPFIVAYIVMDEAAADDTQRAEMKGYVDEMVNTVRAAQ